MFEILNNKPLLLTIDNFLKASECEEIINYSWPWKRSGGYDHSTHASKETPERTSSTVFINSKDPTIPKVLKNINSKISEFFKIDYSKLEPPQLQRYEPGQLYIPHWDYFFHGPHINNNRVCTTIIYLNDNFTGGTTTFPKLNKVIQPKQGKILYFEYDYIQEQNVLTMHSGDKVLNGSKYIVTTWIRKTKWP
jgi:prolyl 4-hydroxylase